MCPQLYYGVKFKFIALYPMTTESQGPESLEDLFRDWGASIKHLRMTGARWKLARHGLLFAGSTTLNNAQQKPTCPGRMKLSGTSKKSSG